MKKALALVLIAVLAAAAFAQEAPAPEAGPQSPFFFQFIGARFKWFVVPTGIDLGFGLRLGKLFAPAPTNLILILGGAYEDKPLTRSDADGTPYTWEELKADGAYDALDFQGELLLEQWLPVDGKDDVLDAWVSWRTGWWDDTGGYMTSVFGERNSLLMHSLALGAEFKPATPDAHMLARGVNAAFTAEWGPGFLNPASSGGADFARFTGELTGWLPLWDARPDAQFNFLSLQACARLAAEYAAGSDIPLVVGQFFGGRRPGQSLGSAVRGYGWGQFDATFKSAANLELRLLGPALFGKRNLMPALFAFFDAGLYSNYHQAPAPWDAHWGLPMSVGGGFALNLLDIAQPSIQIAFPLTDEGGGAGRLDFAVKFFYQF